MNISRPPIAILGVPFDNVTAAEAIALIENMVASCRPHYLVTANVDFLVQAQTDVELRRILFDAHLVLCDGTPLLWASRLLGNPLPERIAGADLVPCLIRIAARKKYRLFFLGATPEAADQAVAKVRAQYPQVVLAGSYSPPFNKLLEMDHDEIKRRILEAKPDLLFVSFGCPKQEKWIAMHYRALGVPVTVGVGATIDFLAGQVKRAPLWMQRTGTEWLFRLAQEPRRLFRRYITDLWVFGWAFLIQWWRLQFRSRTPSRRRENPGRPHPARLDTPKQSEDGPTPHSDLYQPSTLNPQLHCITLPVRFDLLAVRASSHFLDQILAQGPHCLLEMANVEFIDSTGVGLLIHWQKRLQASGRQMVLLAPSPAVQRALALMRLENFFAAAPDPVSAWTLIETRAREQSTLVTLQRPTAAGPLAWHGEITAANAEAVWQQTRAHLSAAFTLQRPESPGQIQPHASRSTQHASDPQPSVTLDLSDVRFIDSSGLGLMVRARKLARQQGIDLAFTGLQPPVQNVLRLARLEQFLLQE